MRVEKFRSKGNGKVSQQILTMYSNLPYNFVMKMIRNKDVRINGEKICEDKVVSPSDEIVFFAPEKYFSVKFDIVYEDENIVIINKPRKYEVVSDSEDDIETLISKQINTKCYAVHRLDRNTTGLLIFAKNTHSKQSLDRCFSGRNIHKFYYALVLGDIPELGDLISYLKKNADSSFVVISDYPEKGFELIETKFKKLKYNGVFSLAEVELLTGKTHQIRAHFSHIGHPILGDEKYGDSVFNKKFKVRYQCLCAEKIIFNFPKSDYLSYLDGREIKLPDDKIDFLKFM